MILARTRPCRKECPTPKKLEGGHSGRGRQYNPYRDHELQLQYATIEERTQPTGAYILYTIYFFVHIFIIKKKLLPSGSQLHTPPIFLFSRPHFATPIRDSPSRPTFATLISRLPFATHIRDPHSRLHSRLTFATPLATHISDSNSRIHSRLAFATPDRAPNRDTLFFIATSVVRLPH